MVASRSRSPTRAISRAPSFNSGDSQATTSASRTGIDLRLERHPEPGIPIGKQANDLQLDRAVRTVGHAGIILVDTFSDLTFGFRAVTRIGQVGGGQLQLQKQILGGGGTR